MDAKGPRYCPSIEDKIVRFADKESHQVRLHRAGRREAEGGAEQRWVACCASCNAPACRPTRARTAGKYSWSRRGGLPPSAAIPPPPSHYPAFHPNTPHTPALACLPACLQIFLEPEGRTTPEMYVQGFSTGLPERLQLALLRSLPGLEQCKMLRPAYAGGLVATGALGGGCKRRTGGWLQLTN